MKAVITILGIMLINFSVIAQENKKSIKPDNHKIVEASCGQCNFGLTSKKGCDLAVRIDGKAYWVEGTDLDSHGDAHGKGGFCTTIRKAKAVGEVVDGKFKVSEFKLLPIEANQDNHKGHKH